MTSRSLRIVIAAAAATIGVAALPACATPAAPESDRSIVISTWAGSIPANWNPLGNPWELYGPVTQALYDSLLMEDLHGNVTPWLAQEFELSEDRKTLVLTLREDVEFQDGTHM